MAIDGMIWMKPLQGHSFVALAKFREGPAIWQIAKFGMEHMKVLKTMKPSVVDGITCATLVVLLYVYLLLHAVAALYMKHLEP